MKLRWSPLDHDCLYAWSRLHRTVEAAAGRDDVLGPDQLAETLRAPGLDPALDTWALWEDEDLVAYGYLRASSALTGGQLRIHLDGTVHPERRGLGLGRELLGRMEMRADSLAAQRFPRTDVVLLCDGRLEGDPVRALLEHRGYAITRYFVEMERALPGDGLPESAVKVRPFRSELAEAVRQAHNDAFVEHWGFTPSDEQRWADRIASSAFRPDVSFVAVGPEGDVRAYVLCSERADHEIYVRIVGTRSSARGGGLAKACLAASLRAAADLGYTGAALDVDAENPTGAQGLYASLGFRPTKTAAVYARVVAATTN